MRLEREGKGAAKVVGKVAANTDKAKASGGVVGMAPVGSGPGMTKNQIKKEKLRSKAEKEEKERLANEASAKAMAALDGGFGGDADKPPPAPAPAPAPAPGAGDGDGAVDKDKKAKKVRKQLKAIADLKEKVLTSLNDDQKKKLDSEKGLVEELRLLEL